MTTPRIRVDTTVNTNVKGSKVFALAFLKSAGVTDAFTEAEIRAFVLPKLGDASLTGSAIVQLDSTTSGEKYHSGRGDETFTGLLTQVFADGVTSGTTTVDATAVSTTGIHVYFMTMDGINETAVTSVVWAPPPYIYYKIQNNLLHQNNETHWFYGNYATSYIKLSSGATYNNYFTAQASTQSFADFVVFSGHFYPDNLSGNTYQGGQFINSAHRTAATDLGREGFMIIRSSIDDPIIEFKIQSGAGLDNGAINKYTLSKYAGELDDWDTWKGQHSRVTVSGDPSDQPILPGYWEVLVDNGTSTSDNTYRYVHYIV
jgi:hypothetical protein